MTGQQRCKPRRVLRSGCEVVYRSAADRNTLRLTIRAVVCSAVRSNEWETRHQSGIFTGVSQHPQLLCRQCTALDLDIAYAASKRIGCCITPDPQAAEAPWVCNRVAVRGNQYSIHIHAAFLFFEHKGKVRPCVERQSVRCAEGRAPEREDGFFECECNLQRCATVGTLHDCPYGR